MPWIAIAPQDVLKQFTPDEQIALEAVQVDTTILSEIVNNVIEQIRGAILSGNYPLGDVGTIPGSLKNDAIAMARWLWLASLSNLESLQTKARKDLYTDALTKLNSIADQSYVVEPPTDGVNPTSGQWQSENKILMRGHPIPRPSTQGAGTTNPYGNPTGPADV